RVVASPSPDACRTEFSVIARHADCELRARTLSWLREFVIPRTRSLWMLRLLPALTIAASLLVSIPARGQDDGDEKKLKRLIDRIAAGDEMDAADASDQLVEAIYGPLMKAIGSLERVPGTGKERSIPEQLRLRKAI